MPMVSCSAPALSALLDPVGTCAQRQHQRGLTADSTQSSEEVLRPAVSACGASPSTQGCFLNPWLQPQKQDVRVCIDYQRARECWGGLHALAAPIPTLQYQSQTGGCCCDLGWPWGPKRARPQGQLQGSLPESGR
jgi:hypothetical protein